MKKITIISIFACLATLCVAQDKYAQISQGLDIYNAVLRELAINYVDTINYEQLNKTAIDRMLQKLDPYTTFYAQSDKEILKMMTTGSYGGVGAIITQYGDYVAISEPYEGMPAQRNDLRAGDVILEIDGKSAKGLKTADVSQMLRGPQGTEVEVVVKRDGEKKNIRKKLVRDVIQLPPVEYYGMVNDTIGYISYREFTENSADDFKYALVDLQKHNNLRGLIIDLRNNGGGLVSQAVNIAELFLPRNTLVVSMKDSRGTQMQEYRTMREPLFPNLPLTVIVNSSSASASEILAGSLQDMDRAVIVGERSYGKGLVQNVRRLPYDTYLKVTTAKYYIPSGRCVQAIDYAKRNDDGSIQRIPDSLTHEFSTLSGRKVRDGGGILPDVELKRRESVNISYYLYVKNIFFDYATLYARNHKSIASAAEFKLSDDDYAEFVDFVKSKNFTYDLQSAEIVEDLRNMAKLEGYADDVDTLLTQLATILKPNIERDLQRFRSDIEELLGSEIVKRYYYQKGAVVFEMRYDEWLKETEKLIGDAVKMEQLLKP